MDTYKIDWLKIVKRLSPYNIKKGLLYMKHFGPKEFWIRLTERFQADDVDYEEWYKNHKPTMEELQRQREAKFDYEPMISILVPVYNTPEEFLKQMIQSVRKQTYDNWELCIANANPANETVADILRISSTKDERIKVKDVPENEGIAQNTNAVLAIATGDYIGLLDHDDLLTPDALYEVVKMINENDRPQVLYSDEDKITMDLSEHFQPHMKPDYNKDLLRSNNYITHFFVAERMLVEEVGGEDGEYNAAQEYELILNCTERANGIAQIPRILYHWRLHKASTADNPASKMYAFDAGKRAIEDHLKRCGEIGKVSHEKDLGFYRVKYQVQGSPLISIIIPNKDQVESLDKCLRSIEKSSYKNYEIIIVENNSTEDETFAYYKKIESDKIRIVYWSDEFNYSAINNFGVKEAKGDYILLLNNDTKILDKDSLGDMLGYCMRPEVGIVGSKLIYGDGTIQHAGVILGLGGIAGHAFIGLDAKEYGYMSRAYLSCDYTAVTAACLMVPKAVFDEVGGLCEEYAVAFNDVDLCMKVRSKGYLVVYDAFSQWYHYESKSRGYEDTPEKQLRFKGEIETFQSKWQKELDEGDPYYNRNFPMTTEAYVLASE